MLHFVRRRVLRGRFLFVFFVLLCFASGGAFAQPFTAGNLAVMRVGDGVTGLISSAQPLNVVEYTTAGVATGVTVALPGTGAAPFITNSGSATSEGQMIMSAERDRLVLVGYNAAAGTANVATSASASINRIMFTINSAAAYTTPASTSTLYSGNNIRSGVASGLNYFAGGPGSGASLLNTLTTLTTPAINTRVVQIFNGQMYFSSSTGTNLGVSSLGTGIPTTCCQTTALLNTPNSPSAYGFSFSPDGNILYIADDASGISKYVKSGATYALAYVVNATTSRSITVDYSGANPVIYATTATSTAPNAIIKITDAGAGSAATTLVAASPANTVFRSISFVPSCGATISLLGSSTVCSGSSASFIIKGNPTGVVSYNINGGATLTTTIKPNGFDTVSTGPIIANSVINLLNINTPACSSVSITGTVSVNVFPAATISSISNDGPLCAGSDLHMNAAITSSVGPYSYTWKGPSAYSASLGTTGALTNSVTVTAIPVTPANPVYTLTVTDANGCAVVGTTTTTVNPLPIAYTVFGTGGYCAGDPGVDVQLSNSQTGVNYQLYNTSGTVGSPQPGTTGAPLDLGVQPAGTYTVLATNPTTGCSNAMTGSAVIVMNPLPATITGSLTACPGTTTSLSDPSGSGTWTSGSLGIATVASATGVVSGVSVGTSVITFTLPTTCSTTTIVTINPSPVAITGGNSVCMSSAITLSDVTGGGTWVSGNTGVATIGSGSGAVLPVSTGNSVISYVLSTGCMANVDLTVNPLPTNILGTTNVCVAANITLSDGMGGGTWSSGTPAFGTVGSSSGIVTGVSSGVTNITYTLPTTCMISTPITVNPLPAAIAGTPQVCVGYTTSLSDVTGGGMWTTGAPGIATVGSTGIVTGQFTGTANIFYTITATGCSLFKNVTVNPLPNTISGPSAVCAGSLTSYTDVPGSGTWISSNTGIATIGAASGTLSAVMAGTATITYSIGTGCYVFSDITVNPLPAAITGTMSVCEGLISSITDGSGGGTWSSSATGNATVDASGNVSGVLAGTPYISYTLPTGCYTTTTFTVNPIPGPINGPANMCAGSSVVMTDAATGGTWVSSAPGFVSINPGSGFTSAIMGGSTTLTYTLPTSCLTTKGVTVNPLPPAVTSTGAVCVGSSVSLSDPTGGGSWSSSNIGYATIGSTTGVATGTGAGFPVITYTLPTSCYTTYILTVNPLPLTIAGDLGVCFGLTTTLSDSPAGGTWSSSAPGTASVGSTSGIVTGNAIGTATIAYTSAAGCVNTAVTTVNPIPPSITGGVPLCPGTTTILTDAIAAGTWSSGSTGVASVGSASGVVTGIAAGLSVISYLPPSGCGTAVTVTVNPLPGTILGSPKVCIGFITPLSDLSAGGTWSSSAPGIASIGSATGLMDGASLGTATITYTLPTGCYITTMVTVNPLPGTISGTATVCPGATTSLSDSPAGGTWSSSATGIASIGSTTGTVTGIATGTAVITYMEGTGCTATATITVNPLPSGILGNMHACLGLTTQLSDADGGGTWSSSATGTASIDALSGLVTAITVGSATITYTLPTGCLTSIGITVDTLPHSIAGNTPVCVGAFTNVSDAGGGTWTSGNTAVATVTSSSGILVGVSSGTAIITYALPSTCHITTVATVNPLPSAITGITEVCSGLTTTLSDPTPSGSWSSGDPSIAIVGSASGVVTGISGGVVLITYALTATGCRATTIVSVVPLPPAITGTKSMCLGASTSLNNVIAGGTWSSGTPSVATIGTSGVVNGISAGTSNITYTIAGGCISTTTVTVNPLPVGITGAGGICVGLTAALTDASAGGTWLSSNIYVAAIGASGVVSAVAAGTAGITYTLPTGCLAYTTVTVNSLPFPISGPMRLCVGSAATLTDGVTGGSWSIDPSASGVAAIFPSTGDVAALSTGTATVTYTLGTGCLVTSVLTVNPVPLTITGTTTLCAGASTTLTDVTTGGSWGSSNITLASVGSGSGIVTAVSEGTPVITYKLSTGCYTTIAFIVNPLPTAVLGNRSVCLGATSSLSDAATGGTWTSASAAIDSVGITSGVVTGGSLGIGTITYTLPTGCKTATTITVNPFPSGIVADSIPVCQGFNILLSDSTPGGTWSSANTAIAGVTAGGMVNGVSAGTVNISYTLSTGCGVAAVVTVNPLFPITGSHNLCLGAPVTFTDGAPGGTWSSGTPAVATIGSSSGAIIGIASGEAYITYHLSTGCVATTTVTVNPLPSSYDVTGGGAYCAGGAGVAIGLNGSDTGINYQLVYFSSGVCAHAGNDSAISFGAFTSGGVYSVLATNTETGCFVMMTGSATITVNPIVVPFVNISAAGGTTICAGAAADFTALPVNGGTSPVYQWAVNGFDVGTGPTFGYVPANGDSVSVKLISNDACAIPDSATSFVFMNTVAGLMPSVSISAGPSDSVCPGIPVTITPFPVNGGAAPTYNWLVNGVIVGSGAVYTYLPNDGDNILCEMHSNYACPLANPVPSDNNINMIVPPIYAPAVTIAAYPGTRILAGETVTLVADVAFSGLYLSYQWKINNSPVPGATSDTFISSTFNNFDTVSCFVTGMSTCGSSVRSSQVLIIDTIQLGIQAEGNMTDIRLLPNPNNGTFAVKGTFGTINEVTMVITDMLGQVVYRGVASVRNGRIDEEIRLGSTIANGMYLLEVTSGTTNKFLYFAVGQ